MKNKNNIPKLSRKIKQKEGYENMKEMGIKLILEEISKGDTKGLCPNVLYDH